MGYKITSQQGVYLGTYEADSEAEALNKMAAEAGYNSYQEVKKNVPGADQQELIIEPE